MNEKPIMESSNVWVRFRKRLDDLEALVRRNNAAPIRNATIDGPVTISHRGGVTATSPVGSTTALSSEGAVSTAADGSAVRLADGVAEIQAAPGQPWVPITAMSEELAQQALDAAAQAVLDAAGAQTSAGQAIIDAAAATSAAASATSEASAASDAATQAALDAAAAQSVADAAQAAADAAAADASGASGDAATAQSAADAAQTQANAAAATASAAQSAAATADAKAVAAQSAASAAQSTADGALLAANNAQSSADGKATITYSTADPSGTAPVNSTWFKFAGGAIIGQWKRAGGAWVAQAIDGVVIANLDAGKITAGILNAALVVIRTAGTGARVVFNGAGIVGYDSDGNVKTVIDATTGKITAVDGTFTGTVTGSNIIGGAIAVAQGTTGTFAQDWETASGTTPPTGWTRSVLGTGGTGGGIDFPTGGNPNRCLRLNSASSIPPGTGSDANSQIVFNPSISGQDFDVAFDYKWTGATVNSDPYLTLVLRGDSASKYSTQPVGSVRIRLDEGAVIVYDGIGNSQGDALGASRATIDTWYKYRIILRGQTLTVVRNSMADELLATYSFTLLSASRTGIAAFLADTRYSGNANPSTGQSVLVDNLNISVLKTGFAVDIDGATTIERLAINGSVTGPDPLLPSDLSTKAYSDSGDTAARSRANHTGTQAVSTISGFDAAAVAANAATSTADRNRANHTGSPTAAWSNGSQKITDVAAGTTSTDAINKGQLDETRSYTRVQATTTNITATAAPGTAVGGLSITFTSAGTAAVYEVAVELDVTLLNAMTNITVLAVDGSNIANPQLVTAGAANSRLAGRKTYYVTGLSAGSHTVVVRSWNGSATTAIIDVHSQMILTRFS